MFELGMGDKKIDKNLKLLDTSLEHLHFLGLCGIGSIWQSSSNQWL
jgi:hypothetical protein